MRMERYEFIMNEEDYLNFEYICKNYNYEYECKKEYYLVLVNEDDFYKIRDAVKCFIDEIDTKYEIFDDEWIDEETWLIYYWAKEFLSELYNEL